MYLPRVLVRISPLLQRSVTRSPTAGLLVSSNKFSSNSSKRSSAAAPSERRDTNPRSPPVPEPATKASNPSDGNNAAPDNKNSYSPEGILADLKEAVMKKETNSYSQFLADKIFGYASENNQSHQIIEEFEKLQSAIEENEEISNFVKYSTIITKEQWKELLALTKEKKVPEILVNALTALYKLHKLRVLPKILDILKAKQDEALGIVRGELVTAEEFSPKKLNAFIQELHEQIDAKEIILKTRVDKNLIGGFILNTPQLKLDTSHSSIINAATVQHAQHEEEELRKLSRAWESGLPPVTGHKVEPAKVISIAIQPTGYEAPIKTRLDQYRQFEFIAKNPEIQAEYRSYAPVSDPDLFLRDIYDQLNWREDGKKLLAEQKAREAYWASLEWDPEIPDDIGIPYFTGKQHQL